MVICLGKGVTVGLVWAFGVSGIAEDAAGHVAFEVFGDFGLVWFIGRRKGHRRRGHRCSRHGLLTRWRGLEGGPLV